MSHGWILADVSISIDFSYRHFPGADLDNMKERGTLSKGRVDKNRKVGKTQLTLYRVHL